MFRKIRSKGISASVVEFGTIGYIFALGTPAGGIGFREQAEDVLNELKAIVHEADPLFDMIRLHVFLRDGNNRRKCHEMVTEVFGSQRPATVCIAQPPCDGKELAVEGWGVRRGSSDLDILRSDPDFVLVRHNNMEWAHTGEFIPKKQNGSAYEQTIDAFRQMRDASESAGFRIDQVIRTWLYLGDIVGMEDGVRRYDELNRARSDFFKGIEFCKDLRWSGAHGLMYPGSTGIGASDRSLVISCIAMKSDPSDVSIIRLENPHQTPAYQYAADHSPSSPKFCRAIAVSTQDHILTLISGTASIVNSNTMHVGDISGQTEQTIDNIESLISSENFARHGLSGMGAGLSDLAMVRVYMKRPEDFKEARAVCVRRLGDVPAVYAVADICRPELLIEIEGMAFSKKKHDE